MKALDYLILLAVAVAVFLALRYMRRRKKQGCSGCSYCKDCKMCDLKNKCDDYKKS